MVVSLRRYLLLVERYVLDEFFKERIWSVALLIVAGTVNAYINVLFAIVKSFTGEGVMKLKQLKTYVAVFACILFPTTSIALPVHYSASGSVIDKQGDVLQVYGSMCIDDQLRIWKSGGPGPAVTLMNDIGIYDYQYYIADYSFTVGNYSFSGGSGYFYMPIYRYPTLNDIGLGDLMWGLNDGIGAWKNWTGEQFDFYNADGSVQDPSQYINLAPLIQISVLDYMFDDQILPVISRELSIRLTLQHSIPVPEPCTVVLLSLSLLVMLGYRRSRWQNNSKAL